MNTLRFIVPLTALAVTLAGQAGVVNGQERTDSVMVERITPRWTTGFISTQLGTANLGLSELNGTLAANGRPTFSRDVVTIGVSASVRFGRFMMGGTGESALPQRATSRGWVNTVSFGSALLDAGYALVERPRFTLQPQISFGIRKTSLRIQQQGDFPYEDGVREPARGLAVSSFSALAAAGVAAELRFSTRTAGDFAVGLRAGFARPLGAPAAWAGESSVTGAPRESAGRYLRLSIAKPIGRRRDIMGAFSTAALSILTQ